MIQVLGSIIYQQKSYKNIQQPNANDSYAVTIIFNFLLPAGVDNLDDNLDYNIISTIENVNYNFIAIQVPNT